MKYKDIIVCGGGKSTQQPTKRIEYIDAMRGFTILLVVMSHVTTFGLGFNGSDVFNYSTVFKTFRMPLFFFVSGFVLYKSTVVWDSTYIIEFVKKKIPVQIITPFLFLLAYVTCKNENLTNILFDYSKGGYWFTFTLFEYFVLYIICQQVIRLFRLKSYLDDILLLGVGIIIYCLTSWPFIIQYRLNEGVAALVGIPTLQTFLFFIVGTRIKKYFRQFERLLDTKYFTAVIISCVLILHLIKDLQSISSTIYGILISLLGIILVFALFRRYQGAFLSTSKIGYSMQFVGRRTLDIYLIHYFFIYSNLTAVLPNMAELNSPFIEFLMSFILSAIIVACCLLVSAVLRLNPWLAHFLFGAKLKQDKQINLRDK